MTYVESTDTIHFTKEERKILELALPILTDIECESYARCNEIISSLSENYYNNNRELSAEIKINWEG